VSLRVEPYVDAKRLAEHLDVSVSTIKRWRREGMPSHRWESTRLRRFRISEVDDWLNARGSSRFPSDNPTGRRVTNAGPGQEK
jgi:hypothetical protein